MTKFIKFYKNMSKCTLIESTNDTTERKNLELIKKKITVAQWVYLILIVNG